MILETCSPDLPEPLTLTSLTPGVRVGQRAYRWRAAHPSWQKWRGGGSVQNVGAHPVAAWAHYPYKVANAAVVTGKGALGRGLGHQTWPCQPQMPLCAQPVSSPTWCWRRRQSPGAHHLVGATGERVSLY